jgi:hypothetical protein
MVRRGVRGSIPSAAPSSRRLPAASMLASEIGADLDQVLVRIAEVDAEDGAGGAGAFDRALLDGDAARGEVLDHLVQRADGDEAQVGAAGRGTVGLRLELLADPVQIDLAVAEGQGASAAGPDDSDRAEDRRDRPRAAAPGLRPPKFEHRNGADSSSLAFVLGKARVAPRLLGVDAVAFSAGQFADGHLIGLGSAFDTPVTGGGQVVVPVL